MSGPGDPEAGALDRPVARITRDLLKRHLSLPPAGLVGQTGDRENKGRGNKEIREVARILALPADYPLPTLLPESLSFRPNTYYHLSLPLEYINPLQARSTRRVGPTHRTAASLAASETIGGDFFEG